MFGAQTWTLLQRGFALACFERAAPWLFAHTLRQFEVKVIKASGAKAVAAALGKAAGPVGSGSEPVAAALDNVFHAAGVVGPGLKVLVTSQHRSSPNVSLSCIPGDS